MIESVWLASSVAVAGPGVSFASRSAVIRISGESSVVPASTSATPTGGSLTAVTAMVKDCGAEVSWPPLAVPPLSLSSTVMVALPLALGAGV